MVRPGGGKGPPRGAPPPQRGGKAHRRDQPRDRPARGHRRRREGRGDPGQPLPPHPLQGEVLAYLNLENLHDPKAFGEDSLEAARFFATPLATLLHEIRTRKLLEEAALTDPLTGLPNRRAFDRFLEEELKRAERYGYPLALAVMDLRGFKQVNDRLGHAVGTSPS